MKNVVLPDCGIRRLSFFLAMEDYVAGKVDGDAFFVWQSEPTVIIGRNQDLEAEVNIPYCMENGIRIVRRKSGGGCVYSDSGNIMISYISRRGEVPAVFDRYLESLAACLRSIGLNASRNILYVSSSIVKKIRTVILPFAYSSMAGLSSSSNNIWVFSYVG